MALDFLLNNRFVRLAKPLTFTFITERSSHNFFAASKTQPVKFAAKLPLFLSLRTHFCHHHGLEQYVFHEAAVKE